MHLIEVKKLMKTVLSAVFALLALSSCIKMHFNVDVLYEYVAHYAYVDDVGISAGRMEYVLTMVSGRTDEDLSLISSGVCVKLHLVCDGVGVFGDYYCRFPFSKGRWIEEGRYAGDGRIAGSYISFRRIGDKRDTVLPVRDGEVEIEREPSGLWDISAELETESGEFEISYRGPVSVPVFGF